MSRPIWKGSISFGLVNIPVTLYSAEKPTGLHFHLMDKRNHGRIRYERVNDKTGKEVPWDQIEKGYEFEKGNFVVVDEKELEKVAYENSQTVELEDFIDNNAIEPVYFDKPYYLIPSKQGEKGYFLLRETLLRSKKAGITRVVIRTRQYLAALIPYKNLLLLNLLRYNDQIRDAEEYDVPEGTLKSYKISSKEMDMAEKLVKSMSRKWNPKKYHDENRELLSQWIEGKIEKGESVSGHGKVEEKAEPNGRAKKGKSAQVIDFMSLLKKSLDEKERKGAAKSKIESNIKGNRTKSTKTRGRTRNIKEQSPKRRRSVKGKSTSTRRSKRA